MPHAQHLRRPSNALRRSIAVALGVALISASTIAGAETAKEKELEARVAELEKLVQQLVAEKKAAPAPVAAPAAAGAVAAAPAAAPAKPDAKAIQPGTILPNAAPGTSFVLTGYAKVDGMWTDTSDGELAENTPSRDFYVPGATPIGQPDEGTDFDAHAKQTRINFGTDTLLAGGDKLSTRFEIDFFGSGTGNQRVTNTYAPVLRHAYVQWREWLVGQTWSNFQDVAALPDSVDFIGTTDGTVFVRQPQVRYTKGGFSLAVENPQTTMTPFGGPADPNSTAWIVETDDSAIPDLTARYAWKGPWGHIAVAGLARELKYERVATPALAGIDASTWSMAGSLSGKFMIGKDDIRFILLGGNLGRYVGLNFTTDAVLTSNGGDCRPGNDRRLRGLHRVSPRVVRQVAQQRLLRDGRLRQRRRLHRRQSQQVERELDVQHLVHAAAEARHRRGVPPRRARTRERRRRLARPAAVHDEVFVLG